jgi:two-component sensor histidine kinase
VLLPCAPASVGVARRRLTAELSAAGVFGQAVGDAVLVISELLSNSIRHAWPLPGEQLQVTWLVDQGCVEVTVSDGGSATRPRQAFPAASSTGGRGLRVVEHLSRDWGVRSDDAGQTVWAVLPAPRPGPGEPAMAAAKA